MLYLVYKYRLYPNKAQKEILEKNLFLAKEAYNYFLEQKKNGVNLSYALIKELKNENPIFSSVYAKVLLSVLNQLKNNLKVLSAKKKKGKQVGKLRFKKRIKTINYNQSGFSLNSKKRKLHLSKIGDINIKLYRDLPNGKVKQVIIKKEIDRWYALFFIEVETHTQKAEIKKAIGIDFGVNHLVVDSEGRAIENLKPTDKHLKRMRVLYRKLSRKKKGSKNFEKAKQKIEKLNLKIKNTRLDYLHKISRFYVNNYDLIVIEDFDIQNLLKGKYKNTLHRHIIDSSWSNLKQQLSYKAARAGKEVIVVCAKNTTQTCSKCGHINEKKLKLYNRAFVCEKCGFTTDRDYNAARNILKAGLGRPVEPVNTYDRQRGGRFEEAPLLCEISAKGIITGQEIPMRQEAPSLVQPINAKVI